MVRDVTRDERSGLMINESQLGVVVMQMQMTWVKLRDDCPTYWRVRLHWCENSNKRLTSTLILNTLIKNRDDPTISALGVWSRKLSSVGRPSDGWPKIYYIELLRASKAR
jgi:hypothetical protein